MEENRKRLHIKYVDRWIKEDDVVLPVYKNEIVPTSHTKRYHNCLYLLANLKGCPRNLMDYFTEIMDSNNMVPTNQYIRDKFIESMATAGVTYAVSSFDKAITALREKGFIISIGRGMHQVNPKYFMKNDDDNRATLLKVMLEFSQEASDVIIETLKESKKDNE